MALPAQAEAAVELPKQDISYKSGPTCPTRLGQGGPYIELVSRAVSRAGDPKERRMIQLATDPNASRTDWRAVPAGRNTDAVADERRGPRQAHAWPFISRQAERPAAAQTANRPGPGSGGS
jgi:hypothetical protein